MRVDLERVRTAATYTTCRATLAVEVPRFVVRSVTLSA